MECVFSPYTAFKHHWNPVQRYKSVTFCVVYALIFFPFFREHGVCLGLKWRLSGEYCIIFYSTVDMVVPESDLYTNNELR